jgi:hypothetical protein
MLTTENAGSLLAGGPANANRVKVRLLTRKGVEGIMYEAGDEVEAKANDATWLVQRGYAEFIKE